MGALKLPSGVLWKCWFNVRHVDPGRNAVHFKGGGCCKEHGVGSLSVSFKALGLMSPGVHRITNLGDKGGAVVEPDYLGQAKRRKNIF